MSFRGTVGRLVGRAQVAPVHGTVLAGLLLLAIFVAGCALNYNPRRTAGRAPDWEAEDSRPLPASSPPQNSPANNVTNPALPMNPGLPVPATAASVPGLQPGQTWVPIVQWCRAARLPAPRLLSAGPPAIFGINTSNGVFTFQTGSLLASWQGTSLRLGFAPQLAEGHPMLHTLDLQKTVWPLLQDSFSLPGSNRVIVLDPGHGGENAGTRSVLGAQYEKDYTLDWARRLAPLLMSNGWTVFLTRTNDSDLALSNRIAFADHHHADLFMSLHFNSAGRDDDQYGLETYCLTPVGMPSTVTRGFSDEIHVPFPNNAFDSQNLEFALRLHQALLQINGGKDRGIRRARFPGVLRGHQRPAILIEGGYLSNPGEARRIATAAYRQKLAEALARALGSPAQAAMRLPEQQPQQHSASFQDAP